VNYGQPEPGALAHFTGGEEWLEDVCQHCGVHAMPGVAHFQEMIAAGLDVTVGQRPGRGR